jgi:Ni,Fe-hydrogenase III large subunit
MELMIEDLDAGAWANQQGVLIALWTDATHAYALYQPARLVAVALVEGAYPALSPSRPGAAWFERLAHDLRGHVARGGTDARPAIEQFRAADGTAAWPVLPAPDGSGIHQVALGPVHGGVTEPAHFRFSVIGELVVKLEMRLGYSHRGILGLIRGKSARLAARFAARVAGDSTVAHSLAFAQAAEAALGLKPPPRAVQLRAIMAELERCANHAGDCGAIAEAAGFGLGAAGFARQREALCAAAGAAFGHRLMMDAVIPGGVAEDLREGGAEVLRDALDTLTAELPGLRRMMESDAGLADRLNGAGLISPALAAAFGAGGIVGRASGQRADARISPGYAPYTGMEVKVPVTAEGDHAARLLLRLAELEISAGLIRGFLQTLPDGPIALPPPAGSGAGLGVAESCRGPVWVWLTINAGLIEDVFIADPSARLWPLLEIAAAGGDLAEFPLLACSINASPAGADL